jgi:hypothetical protein
MGAITMAIRYEIILFVYSRLTRSLQIHLSLEEPDLIIRCQKGDDIEEYIPSSVLARDLPRNLIEGSHFWYKERVKRIEVRPITHSWSRDIPKLWRAILRLHQDKLVGEISKELEMRTSQLVDVHSPLYQHFSLTLRSLESQPGGLLVTLDNSHPMGLPSVYIPRHDLTFFLNSVNRLECQSFPGFLLDYSFQGIKTLIGLESMISLCKGEPELSQRKILVPKGKVSSEIGTYGHPSISIELQDQGGYFAYEIDSLLGRLQGSRSVESDLFLIQLHAFTSSSLPDDLTGRSGTSEALEYLSSSSCFSMHTLSAEARSYLNTLASLTPVRSLSSLDTRVMETIKWDSSLPILSQHPSFLPLVNSILEHWRKIVIFHSFGDLLKPIKRRSGMNHLSERAGARNWVFHHPVYSREFLEDSVYEPRDCMKDMLSQEREKHAYQVARLCQQSTSISPFFSLSNSEIMWWGSIHAAEHWDWSDISRWLPYAKFMGKIWQSLYKSCSESVTWPLNFEVTAALSLLGYCEAPFEFLVALTAIARRPHLISRSPSLNQSLDLSQGDQYDSVTINRILATYAVPYEQSREAMIQRGPNEEWHAWQVREQQARQLYRENLSQHTNQVLVELRGQWPSVPSPLNLSARHLLRLNQECIQRLHSTLMSWSRNRDFLSHMHSIPAALTGSYTDHINWPLYNPMADIAPRDFVEFRMSTIKDFLWTMAAPSVNPDTVVEDSSNWVLPPLPTEISNNLTSLVTLLNEGAQSPLEQHYVLHLSESINATRPPSEARGRLPTLRVLESRVEVREASHTTELHRLKDALTPRDYTTVLREAAGIFPTITPMALLRQLSFKNRPYMSDNWRDCTIGYAIKLHDAKRARRMFHLLQEDRKAQLSLEHHYSRGWNPDMYLDWLLIEIDSNFSVRPEQASMALEMLTPANGQSSVMQLNMGEGKSSVSTSRWMRKDY